MKKKIKIEIEVPEGEFCWDGTMTYGSCDHFDNYGGSGTCELQGILHGLVHRDDSGRYHKSQGCDEATKCNGQN